MSYTQSCRLGVADKVRDILKKAEEIKAMKLGNKKIADELAAEADDARKHALETIAASTPAPLKPNSNGEDKAIVENAVRKLIGFLEKGGGGVDCILPSLEADGNEDPGVEGRQDQYRELREKFRNVRELESKLKLIGRIGAGRTMQMAPTSRTEELHGGCCQIRSRGLPSEKCIRVT